MKTFLVQSLKKHYYLLIVAAWLLTIAFIVNTYIDSPSSARVVRNSIENFLHSREEDFLDIVGDTAVLRKMVSQEVADEDLLTELASKRYTILVYEPRNFDGTWALQFWNNQYIVADDGMLQLSDTNYFAHLRNGYYEVIRKTVFLPRKGSMVVFGMIPVRWEYFIPFQNLPHAFVEHKYAEKKIMLSDKPTDLQVKSSLSNQSFYLERREQQETATIGWLTITFIVAGVMLLLYFLQQLAHDIAAEYGLWRAIMFLVTAVLLIRGATYLFPGLLDLRRLELFDPTIYSSGLLQSSLGDLLINAFLFCWVIMFIRRESRDIYFLPDENKIQQWIRVTVILAFLVLSTFYFSNLVRSLIADGNEVSFNVLDFFSLNIYSFVGFIVLACLALGYFFLSQILVRIIYPTLKQHLLIVYIIMTTMGLVVLTLIKTPSIASVNIFTLVWLLFFVWLLYQRYFGGLQGRLNPTEVLFWLFIFSLSISGVIITENGRIELEQRKRQAEKLFFQADPSSERRLSIALTYFDNDFLYPNFERFKSPASNRFLKDSLANKNFSAYLDQYENHIYTFNADGTPLFNSEPISYDTLNTIFRITAKPTSITNVKYFEKSFDKFAYIFRQDITDSLSNTIGYLFVLSEPKRYKSDALIPELFRQPKQLTPDYSPYYSYAIYNNGDLIDYYNDYQFSTHLKEQDVPKKEFDRRMKNGYDELWYRHSKDKVVIIAKKDNTIIEAMTLFAYLFSAFLFLLASFRIISLIIQSRFRLKLLRHSWQLNIRSQIHSTIIFISLLSFVIIGIATIFFFINRYNRNNQERLSRAIQIMTNELQTEIQDHSIFNDVKLYELGPAGQLDELVSEVADIHDADINLYDLNGNLIVSSNPLIYDKGILSKKMDAEAFHKLHNSQLVQFVNEEEVGLLNYLSIYCPVRDEAGNAYAYLNIPSFTSQQALKQEISNFLVTIINLNAFIFLIAGAIALFITNRITSSFTLIGQKMQQINLGKLNEEIVWDRQDEIGELVKEYNTMVHKLEDSAAALAKSEREGAWRQMARQVAHEIKNPLTPMKLSIQYLQKAIDNNSPNVKEMTANVAKTLVEQIDHLSKIASDFSQFANIGNVRNEVFDLHEVIYSITSLYEATEKLEFNWQPVKQRIMVMMDKTQINRLLTNLLQNAIEACDNRDVRRVSLTEEIQGDSILLKITDNGEGIPDTMRQKIFVPNFTTKSSGTGLGLAMSKAIVEQAKGDIWFETAESVGTTFFIQLPLLRAMN
ncbi:MAG TPA: HAMP domain-containing sensor histidine kinase [Chitinophagaceae bacterium]|nr:HAMP domain-containing sensor histidine kinase [Chitinophagaceae bacterium]